MRVTCKTLTDFLTNIVEAGSEKLYGGTVWTDVTKREENEGIDEIVFQADAVVREEDGSEYFLQYGQSCGRDYYDGDPGREGSRKAEELEKQLREFCKSRDLKVRPGVLSE